MAVFVNADPAEFYVHPKVTREMLVRHEMGHLLLAYMFGFDVAYFEYKVVYGQDTALVKNRVSKSAKRILGKKGAIAAEAQKLLAGEIAARLYLGLKTDEIVAPLDRPPLHKISRDTDFGSLKYSLVAHDFCKLLKLYREKHYCIVARIVRHFGRKKGKTYIEDNWYEWIWACHNLALSLLQKYFKYVENLAKRVEKDTRNRIPGKTLIRWCKTEGVPVFQEGLASKAYDPDRWFFN